MKKHFRSFIYSSSFLFIAFLSSSYSTDPAQLEAAKKYTLKVSNAKIKFGKVRAEHLHQGYIDKDKGEGKQAVLARVKAGKTKLPWKLYLRAKKDLFSPEGIGKTSEDLKWKLDSEGFEKYRPLTTDFVEAYSSTTGDSKNVAIDLISLLNWEDDPAAYSLDLEFKLEIPNVSSV